MAIGPDDARELTDKEEKLCDEVEEVIDIYLRNNFSGEEEITFTLHNAGYGNLSKRIIQKLDSRYQDEGWDELKYSVEKITGSGFRKEEPGGVFTLSH